MKKQLTSKEKNKYVNDITKPTKEDTNNKYYYKRFGKCNYKKCQSACCRFICYGTYKFNKYHESNKYDKIVKIGKQEWGVDFKHCSNLTFNGLCKLHNKPSQPRVCSLFPMSPDDGVYIILKKFCGYYFKKFKNPYYKYKRKKKVD